LAFAPADLLILDWERKRNTRPLQMLLGRELCARGAGFVVAPPAENTAEKQRVRQQMLARNWHDDAISSELGSFCRSAKKSHLIAGLIDLS
jgi:hypothetical protein